MGHILQYHDSGGLTGAGDTLLGGYSRSACNRGLLHNREYWIKYLETVLPCNMTLNFVATKDELGGEVSLAEFRITRSQVTSFRGISWGKGE